MRAVCPEASFGAIDDPPGRKATVTPTRLEEIPTDEMMIAELRPMTYLQTGREGG